MTKISISAYKWVPPFAQGLVRDLRVRWALEEAGLPYEEILLDVTQPRGEEYLKMQPYGQVPVYKEGDLVIFESAAIVMHIAEKTDWLMPADPVKRARTRSWMFSAMNTIEPHVMNLSLTDLFYPEESWSREARAVMVQGLEKRLNQLSTWLSGRDYLEDEFTAADLLMVTVLRTPRHTEFVKGNPVLHAYVSRCEARPAFARAFASQMRHFS